MKQFQFTDSELITLMEESKTFRDKFFKQMNESEIEKAIRHIKTRFPNYATADKIEAIKWLREYSSQIGADKFIKELLSAGYEVVSHKPATLNGFGAIEISYIITLTGAKKFVENIK